MTEERKNQLRKLVEELLQNFINNEMLDIGWWDDTLERELLTEEEFESLPELFSIEFKILNR